MSGALISGPYFIKLIHLPVLSILSPVPDFIYLSPGSDFIKLVRVRNFIYFESKSGSYQGSPEGESGSGFYQFFSPGPGPGPDFIPRPGPEFIYFIVQIRVWVLPSMSGSASGFGFYQHLPGPYMVKTFQNLLLRNQEADDLETWYTASGTQVRHNLFKRRHWFDLDNCYGIVTFVS